MPGTLKSKFFALLFLFTPLFSAAQELNCNVEVSSLQVSGTDKRVFETLQQSIFEFINNTKWTGDTYETHERIECSILINVTKRLSTDEFQATITVQSRRPIFNTGYNSVLLNHTDNDFQFRYLEFQPLEFTPASHTSNLTAVLAYYAYLILALDYDSFSPEGGTPYYQKAMNIVNNAQNVQETGWKAFEGDRNRYWIIENNLSETFAPLRNLWYGYHMEGLDKMSKDIDGARDQILASLETLKPLHRIKPLNLNVQMFFNAKTDEIVNIFSEAYPDKKARVVQLLNELNPGHSSRYQKILESR